MKALDKIKDKLKGKGKDEGLEAPHPDPSEREVKKKVDPRVLITIHKNGYQDLKKLEVELKNLETGYLYRITDLKKELEQLENQLIAAGYSEVQLIENKENALKEMDRANYRFLEEEE